MRGFCLRLIVVAALLVLALPAAHATTMQLKISDGTTTKLYYDDGTGDFADDMPGYMLISTRVGVWNIVTEQGTSKPVIGGPDLAMVDLNNSSITSSLGGTLDIWVTDTDFVTPVSPPALTWLTSIGGTTQGSVSFEAYLDQGNQPFGTTTFLGALGPFTGSGGAFGGDVYAHEPANAPYSLTIHATILHAGRASTTFDGAVQGHLPEPSALVLLGSGLAGLGVWRMRQSKKA